MRIIPTLALTLSLAILVGTTPAATQPLPPGSLKVVAASVTNNGVSTRRSQTTLEQDRTNNLAVTLEESLKLTGTVLNPDGKPAARVSVALFPFHNQSTNTDAEGRFALPAPDPNQAAAMQTQPVLIARDASNNLAATLELPDNATNAVVKLLPGLTVAGRVTDVHGKPLTNAQADVVFMTERMGSTLGSPAAVDAQGRFELKGLPQSSRYIVGVSAKGFGRGTHSLSAEETDKPRIDLETIQLTVANLRLAGVVLDADDKPVANAYVYCNGEGQPSLNARADAKGRFSFDQVCAGSLFVSANGPRGGGYGRANAEGGDTNITIQLGSVQGAVPSGAAKISGSVVDPAGNPAAKVKVSLFPGYGQAEKQTDVQGRFSLSANQVRYGGSGTEARVIIARDPARNLATALDVDEDATNADLKLEPALTLAGRATDVSGRAISNAQAQAMLWTERMGSSLGAPVRADADGRFELKALPPGRRYSVIVSAKNFGQEQRRLEPAENQTNRIELEPFQLLAADQRIAGVVLDAEDKPVARASLYTYGDKQPNLNGLTDAQGRFSFDKVCVGQIHISANSQRSGGHTYGNVTAEGGDTNITIHVSSSPGARPEAPRPVSLKDKPLPDLAPLGFAPADCPPERPILAVLVDAEQRPSRRALRLIGEQAPALKQKGVTVVVLQSGTMAEDAFAAWKQEAGLPFPIRSLKDSPDKARLVWGASALPWLILTDKTRQVVAEGFAPDELDAKLASLAK